MDVFTGCEQQIEIAENRINKYTMVTVPKYQRDPTDKIPVRSTLKMNTFNVLVVLSIVLISITTCQSAALPEETATKICHSTTPCGWAVYIPYTRRVDYFMKNTCICPDEKTCIRSDDDLSVSAYVYRCGEKSVTTEKMDVPVY